MNLLPAITLRRLGQLGSTLSFLLLVASGGCNCMPPTTDAGPEPDAGPSCTVGDEGCDCQADGTCGQDLACEDDTCEACTWGSVGCPCLDDDTCTGAALCDQTTDACRLPTACESAGCAQYQLCENPGGGDAVCLEACEAGYTWNAATMACDATPSCTPGSPGYLDCGAGGAGVACVDDAQGARCEGCVPGYVEVGEECLAADDCATYCGPGRDCTLPGDGGPAACLGCLTGFVYDDDADACVDRVTCAELNCGATQFCIPATPTTDAECRDEANCPAGQVDPGNGSCVDCVQCYDDPSTPFPGVTGVGNGGYAAGATCVCELEEGYFQSVDGEVKPCDADSDGWTNADLLPVLLQGGGENPFASEQRCTVRQVRQFELAADVPALAGLFANAKRVLTVEDIVQQWNLPSSSYLLDAANRAYVRLFEPEVLDVQSLFELRYTSILPEDRLRNYGGHTGPTLPDPGADGGVVDGGAADAGGPPGDPALPLHRLTAAEVNPLTKACNFDVDDLNLDSVADVSQSHDVAPTSFPASAVPGIQVFYRMAYFLELHRAGYRDRTAECAFNVEVPCHGAYVIAEKGRALGAADPGGLELGYVDRSEDGFAADYWETCARSRDADYLVTGQGDPVNMDFAAWHQGCEEATGSCLVGTDLYGDGTVLTPAHVAYDGRPIRANASLGDPPVDVNDDGSPRWQGMNHHSQFKCVSGSTALPAAEAQRAPPSHYDLNDCRLEPRAVDGVAPGATDPNPKDPYLRCTKTEDGAVPNNGYNYWAAVVPPSNDVDGDYERGCASEGAEWWHLCAASDVAEGISGAVKNATATYGQLFCVCGAHRTGVTCEIGCPPSQTVSSSAMGGGAADVEIVAGELVFSRTWMCLRPVASHGTSTGVDGEGVPYSLTGEIPAGAFATSVLTGTDGTTTYTLSAPKVAP